MQLFSRTVGLLLLVAVTIVPLAALDFLPDAASHGRPAACHNDGGSVPAPEPASHSCCQAAHYPAILQSSASLTSFQRSTKADFFPYSVASASLAGFRNVVIVSGDPPITSPLRV